jgi:two-component system, OmpR family, sensor kinase
MTSIRRMLLVGLLSGLLAAVLVAAAVIFINARVEANRLFDSQLQQIAESFPSYAVSAGRLPPLRDFVADGRLVIQVWSRDPFDWAFSNSLMAPPRQPDSGFVTVTVPGGSWRVYTHVGDFDVVQIAQPMSVRSRQAAAVALRTVMPLLLLLPLLGLLVWVIVGHGLDPLRRAALEVSRRSPDALQPIEQRDLPEEVQPLIGSLNGLLERLSHALESQRAFVADAAHALRTPVTALQLQVQLLERAQSEQERAAATGRLKDGLKRMTHLVEQLLTLARQDPAHERADQDVELDALAAEVVGEQSVLAAAKSIDLGLVHAYALTVTGDREALRVLLSNLVDNAIRYTPAGGRVDVAVTSEDGRPVLTVEDTGPGIPPEERPRVFDRFYRAEQGGSGSGLGLAIVENIARRHGAHVELDSGKDGRGLKVSVRFGETAAKTG